MIRTIHLHGRLGKIFGKVHKLDTATAGEVVRAFNAIFPQRFIKELETGSYHVIRGKRIGGLHLQEDDLNSLKLGRGDLHIAPVVEGSKKGGKGKAGGSMKAILGVVLIGAAIFFSGGTLAAPLAGMGGAVPGLAIGGMSITWGNIAMFGLAATLLGASQMLTKQDKPKEAANDASFAVNGPASTFAQGNPIPIIAGLECIVGAQVISVSSSVGDIPIDAVA